MGMSGLARAKKLRRVTAEWLPLRSVALALFLALGILCGYALSARCGTETGAELRRYLDGYLALAAKRAPDAGAALETLLCFFRAPLLAFLLGFASIGVLALPLLYAAQGFVLSFSLFAFAEALGRDGFALLPALFGIRLLFVLPCTFLLGCAAFEKSRELAALSLGGEGRRTRSVCYGPDYWYRLAACCVCLLLGSALELWLVPRLLGPLAAP